MSKKNVIIYSAVTFLAMTFLINKVPAVGDPIRQITG